MASYSEGQRLLFIDNDNVDGTCLNRGRLHLNKTGYSKFLEKETFRKVYDLMSCMLHILLKPLAIFLYDSQLMKRCNVSVIKTFSPFKT